MKGNHLGRTQLLLVALAIVAVWAAPVDAQVCNVKVVTDASPDYSDMQSMIHSITSNWSTPAEKCWAMFYFNHIARRQTSPMTLHGRELTDPIRQFNDYGYMMCSTIAGANCAIWHNMGLDVRFWDISLHTVSECFYEGRWHILEVDRDPARRKVYALPGFYERPLYKIYLECSMKRKLLKGVRAVADTPIGTAAAEPGTQSK